MALYRSVRIALADSAGTQQAMRLEPANEAYIARDAIRRNDEGDLSSDVDYELRRALSLNPADSTVLRALGLREELSGNRSAAERNLLQSVAVDRTFRPIWALANFYARTGQDAELRLAVKRCFEIIASRIAGERAVHPEPLFDLCWNRNLPVPRGTWLSVSYVGYLMRHERVDAIAAVLPDALKQAASVPEYETLLELCDFLVRSERTEPATTIWNHLVNRGFLQSTPLNASAAHLIADPDFAFPVFDQAFGWKVLREQGTFVSSVPHRLSFEFTGKEPESFQLLAKTIPVLPGHTYRLSWTIERPSMEGEGDTDDGLSLRISGRAGEGVAVCPLWTPVQSCLVQTPQNRDQLRMGVWYDRLPGSVRMEGVIKISGFNMELQQ
ncbi:MAG: hypothetical protein M3N41_07605 [Acidobacteriota bacterium]|nr:hypothetical protein [Acidobacteriota bacterium]